METVSMLPSPNSFSAAPAFSYHHGLGQVPAESRSSWVKVYLGQGPAASRGKVLHVVIQLVELRTHVVPSCRNVWKSGKALWFLSIVLPGEPLVYKETQELG